MRARERKGASLRKFATSAILLQKLHLVSDRKYRRFSIDNHRVFNVDTLPSLLGVDYYSNKIAHPSIITNKMFICVVKACVTRRH